MGWQKVSGYNPRALIEADVARWERVIDDALRSHADTRRATEVTIAVHALNRMLGLGRAEYVRVGRSRGHSRPFGAGAAFLALGPRCMRPVPALATEPACPELATCPSQTHARSRRGR